MQKPQQRKYHSSCNRSVHRGTAHGRQRVKICKRKTPHLLVRSFLSPYGDKLQSIAKLASAIARFALSSPYGDGTSSPSFQVGEAGFSPPYGDCTVPTSARARCSPSSPPYGDGTEWHCLWAVPLLFSPPCGDCTKAYCTNSATFWFSPPYGDGTSKGWYL